MTDHSWTASGAESPPFDASVVEGPSNSSSRAMRNVGDQNGAGASTVPITEPVSERSLRKRKRDKNTSSSIPFQGGHSDHPDSHVDAAADPYLSPQAGASGNVDASKRLKVGNVSNPPPILPDSLLVPLDKSQLPGELWQHIFKFLPPHTLGRLLWVSKKFALLLSPVDSELPTRHATLGALNPVHPNSIWATSRKYFHPGMPRPLSFLTELEMWKLVSATACQFCNKHPSDPVPDASPWESGPGESGVRIIWPFGVRVCGQCIHTYSEKEMDLLFSSTLPSPLVPAIPFAFFTPSMHYISSTTLRGSQLPAGLSLTKLYLKAQIEEMKRKFEEVKSLGSATAEEWVKGLEGNGKEKMADAARWEQWELSGGLRALQGDSSCQDERVASGDAGTHDPDSLAADTSALDTNGRPAHTLHSPPATNLQDSKQMHTLSPESDNVHHASIHALNRGDRNLREVNESKANRKAEIERRCLELDPPLTPGVLSHMDSFTAAILIATPLTDRDWEILKPRLLAQREVAEHREEERIKQEQILHAKTEERRQQEAQLKEAKEVLDREWEDVQKPIREGMAAYADEIIREGWRGGDGVTKEKCPKFAADVLIYVRDKFYNNLAKQDAIARAEGKPIDEDPPNAPPKRKLILENMKWIFDTKIKPLTERHQKELFLCNGCENNTKYYGFEGVVQHYAAKHTSVLSLGSVVVHWRAEWPEQPPFHPNPTAARALMYAMPRPVMGQPHMYGNQHPPYVQGLDPNHPIPPEGYPQPSPGRYTRTPYGTPYGYGSGPYRPPSPGASQFYPGQQQSYGYPPPPQSGYGQNVPPAPYGSPYPGPAYQPPPYPPPYGHPPPHVPPPYNNPYGGAPGPRRGGPPNQNPGNQGFGVYQAQFDEVAKSSRNLWNGTSGIKDLPHNVRAQILIHHVVARFVERFSHEPPLSLFVDALNRHGQMKPVKNLSGLMCKSCGPKPDHRRNRSQEHRGGDRKMFTLPALISHFLSMHGESYDWKTSMLVLPDDDLIARLVHAPGMDDNKFNLVASTFPWVFPHPPPRSPMKPADTPPLAPGQAYPRPDKAAAKPVDRRRPGGPPKEPSEQHQKVRSGYQATHPGLEVAVDNFPRFVDSPPPAHEKPLEPPRDDEYDPHRPAFVDPMADDPSHSEERHRSRTAMQQSTIPIHGKDRHPGSVEGHPVQGIISQGAPQNLPPGAVTQESLRPEERPGSSVRHVSEDGEVPESQHPPSVPMKSEQSMEGISAAEHFLSNFDPGQERADYKDYARGKDRQFNHRGRYLDLSDAEERRYRKELDYGAPGDNPGTQSSHRWRGHTKSPGSKGHRDMGSRPDPYEATSLVPSRHAEDVTPDPNEARHGKRNLSYAEPAHPGRRPQSGFDRYEAQRQSSMRPRSRSPMVHEAVPLPATYYRERSPPRVRARQRPVYAGQPPEPYSERHPHEQVAYSRVPQQYHYVDDPRYAEPTYDGSVDYIPVRVAGHEHQDSGTYYTEQPVRRDAPKEYVDYEMEYQHPAVQGYSTGTAPRDAHGMPGAPPRRRYR